MTTKTTKPKPVRAPKAAPAPAPAPVPLDDPRLVALEAILDALITRVTRLAERLAAIDGKAE